MGLRIKFKFEESHKDVFVAPEKRFFKSIFWNWTHECNYRCGYCYLSSGEPYENELNTQEAKQAIDKMAEADVRTIVLGGGEPLIRKDSKELIDYIYDNGFEIKMCTNGYLLDKEMLDFLTNRNVVGLQIAFEGTTKEIYDKIKRPLNKDSFEKVSKAIDMVTKEYSVHNIISMVPVQQNKNDIIPMMNFCRENGVETLSLYKIIPYGRILNNKEMLIPENEFLGMLPKWVDNFVENKPHWILETEPPYAEASGILKRYEEKIPIHYSGCKAGITLLSVMPNGKITPCHAADTQELYCGDIRKDNLKDIWESRPILEYFTGKKKPEGCEPCEYWKSCLGGCRVASVGIYGTIDKKDPLCSKWFKI